MQLADYKPAAASETRLFRLAEAAPWLSELILGFVARRGGVVLVNRLATVVVRLWPRAVAACGLRSLEWAGRSAQHQRRAISLGSEACPALPETVQGEACDGQLEWLVEQFNSLPARRKAQLATLGLCQLARVCKRQLANRRARSEGRPLTHLRWLILATTDACNLRCAGCYAKPVWRRRHVPFSRLEYVGAEAERLGVDAIFITGWGEPFYDRRDKASLFHLAHRHAGMLFVVFTNGTLVTDDDACAVERLGNLIPLLSLDGLEQTNDARRGQGVFRRVESTARKFKLRGIPFGMSVTVTSANYREVTDAKFVDTVRSWGALWVLYLGYSVYPLHPEAAWLSLSPEQTVEYYDLLKQARRQQPIPLLDADEEEQRGGGCPAQRGELAFVDAVTGRVSACVKLPFAPPTHNLFRNPTPGRLAELLRTEHFREFWRQFPQGWQCGVGCKLDQAWAGSVSQTVKS